VLLGQESQDCLFRRPNGGQTLWEESLWMRKRKTGPSEWETQTSISQAEKDVYGAANMYAKRELARGFTAHHSRRLQLNCMAGLLYVYM
jgi:hypothetical protein